MQACASTSEPIAAFDYQASAADPARDTMRAVFLNAQASVEGFWAPLDGEIDGGTGFDRAFLLTLASARAEFDAALPPEWGLTSQCWMVGLGVSDRLVYLSPSIWAEAACEHDPDDAAHIRKIAVHEMMHVHHGQRHPVGDFTGSESVSWFIEGLAVYAAGQLTEDRFSRARPGILAGEPAGLQQAWRGPHRYAVAGSMVAYVDEVYGRRALWDLLSATSQEAALARLDASETDFLAAWRGWVAEQGGA